MRLTVRGRKTHVEYADVEVNAWEAWRAIRTQLLNLVKLDAEEWVRDGKVWREVDHPHRSYDEEVCVATAEQVEMYARIKATDDLIRKLPS